MGDVMGYELDATRVESGQGSAEKQRCALSEQRAQTLPAVAR